MTGGVGDAMAHATAISATKPVKYIVDAIAARPRARRFVWALDQSVMLFVMCDSMFAGARRVCVRPDLSGTRCCAAQASAKPCGVARAGVGGVCVSGRHVLFCWRRACSRVSGFRASLGSRSFQCCRQKCRLWLQPQTRPTSGSFSKVCVEITLAIGQSTSK